MWDVTSNGINYLPNRPTQFGQEECDELSNSIPDTVAVLRMQSNPGISISGLEHELRGRYFKFIERAEYYGKKEINTLILVLPQFIIDGYTDINSYHLKGYRDLDKSKILREYEPVQDYGSLSLVHTFMSVDNSENKSFPLGHVFELGDKFRETLVKYGGEKYRNMIEKIFLVTSTYYEQNDVDSMKSLHIIMRGLYKAVGQINSVPLKKWVENFRRGGAEKYVGNLVNQQTQEKNRLVNEIDSLKTQMTKYFRQLTPIEFFINDSDKVIAKINDELTKCENVRGVKSAYLDHEGSFHVYTEHIYIKQQTNQIRLPGLTEQETAEKFGNLKNMYWDIGKLHITVKKKGTAHIISNSRQVKGYNDLYVGHPHVIDSENGVCLGDIAVIVFELLNRHDYASLAGLLVNFAKSVNLNDGAGNHVRSWPTVQLNLS